MDSTDKIYFVPELFTIARDLEEHHINFLMTPRDPKPPVSLKNKTCFFGMLKNIINLLTVDK